MRGRAVAALAGLGTIAAAAGGVLGIRAYDYVENDPRCHTDRGDHYPELPCAGCHGFRRAA